MSTVLLVGWDQLATILAFTVFKNPWTVDSANVTLAGLGKVVMHFAWAEERAPNLESAIASPCKAGAETCVKFLGVLELVWIAQDMEIATVLHTNARAILVGLEWDVKYQTALVHLIVTTAGIATLLSNLPNVKTAAKAGWDPHAQIHVNLESRFQWTVGNATAGLVIQVSEKFSSILHVLLVSFSFRNELFLALQVCVYVLCLVTFGYTHKNTDSF